jgi:crotonobetainyl-CoA:carnitine CoA-transferase CaiB-like acyl-CoA transferase
VVIESFRPGTFERLGLGHDAIAAVNPGVVHCSISAFGSGRRAAALPGYDLLLQAMSGLMSVTGEADGRPLKVGAALIDMLCAARRGLPRGVADRP